MKITLASFTDDILGEIVVSVVLEVDADVVVVVVVEVVVVEKVVVVVVVVVEVFSVVVLIVVVVDEYENEGLVGFISGTSVILFT